MKNNRIFIVCLSIFTFFSLPSCSEKGREYFPAEQWRTAAPEERGIDSGKLADMIGNIREEKKDIHSILVVRGGYLVMEAYFHPYGRDDLHNIYSATKSMSALLTGIAVDEGHIGGVGLPVTGFFPGYAGSMKNSSARKDSLTLFHVLTMSDGLDWTDHPYMARKKGDFLSLLTASDGIAYYLDKPMRDAPGTRWNYNSGSSYMLAAIIQKTTGMTALEYARRRLFEPIGIDEACWGTYQDGISNGGSEMFLRPVDFARIGYLVLKGGRWGGKRVVSESWIREMTTPYLKDDFLEYRYGYQWYIDESLSEKSFSAQGIAGQYLFVIPRLDMVVVFTGSLIERDPDIINLPFYHLRDYILPSVRSDEPLPADPEGEARLDSLLREIGRPGPAPVPELPALAGKVSGKTFIFEGHEGEDNIWGLESVTLDFPGGDGCRINYTFSGDVDLDALGFDAVFRTSPLAATGMTSLVADVGLDGLFRKTPVDAEVGPVSYFARGGWTDEWTFEVEVKGGWCFSQYAVFTFEDEDSLSMSYRGLFYRFSLRGASKR